MSIWSPWGAIGYDLTRKPPRKMRGQVRSFATGWSNHYPNAQVEAPAQLDLATLPSRTDLGHEDDTDDDAAGPWLRLGMLAPDARSWWRRDDNGEPVRAPVDATVVLDEEAARALRDDLTEWLDMPKARPRKARR